MTIHITITLVCLLLAALIVWAPRATAHSVRFGHGTPAKRVLFLEQRLKHHRYVCANGAKLKHTRWHCRARGWVLRELRETRKAIHDYQYAWQEWLPDKWARVGACETGYGQRPGRWDWDSGTYVSAFGIIRVAYNQFARELGLAEWNGRNTPRDQWRVADAIQRRYGFGAWGCGGA